MFNIIENKKLTALKMSVVYFCSNIITTLVALKKKHVKSSSGEEIILTGLAIVACLQIIVRQERKLCFL